MCELFGMSSQQAATVNISINTFAQHGGGTDIHKDGWGVVYYEGNDVRRIRDTSPAVGNEWIQFLEKHSLKSNIVISHIRKATRGSLTLNNTQPFCKELAGKVHSFSHNGDLEALLNNSDAVSRHYQPLGETDSEIAFCMLLSNLSTLWLKHERSPPLNERVNIIHQQFRNFSSMGIANFIYTDSEYLYAYSDKRTQKNNSIASPGLYKLERHCQEANLDAKYLGLSISKHYQKVVLVASVPLSNENWIPIEQGELLILQLGKEIKDY